MIGPPVFQVEVADFLWAGTNSIAVRAIAARKTATWMPDFVHTKGAIAVKMLAGAPGINRPVLLISNTAWKASSLVASGWEAPGFNFLTGWRSCYRAIRLLKRHPYGFHMGGRKEEWAHHPARHARGAMELLDRRAG
jgi:hypothetical protein